MNDKTIQELADIEKIIKVFINKHDGEGGFDWVGCDDNEFTDIAKSVLSIAEQEAKEEPLDKISNPDLIAELERRRPDCMKCANRTSQNPDLCIPCVWVNGLQNNFKEAK